MKQRFRVTYATLSADNEELHAGYDEGVRIAQTWLGQPITPFVDGAFRPGGAEITIGSPHDPSVEICVVKSATTQDIDDAVAAARAAAPSWAATPWRERIAILRRAADLISSRSNEMAALMSMEVGKNRLEALGDVEESADLIRYNCDRLEANDGFDHPMGTLSPNEATRSVLRPYGVWVVISPFNYPASLTAGPVGAALLAGNTVLIKPSPQGAHSVAKFFECLREAGLPAGAAQLLPGGDEVGAALVDHPGVDGLTFTGSSRVGMGIFRRFSGVYPKPVVCEMGGKNPTIISAKADLDIAAEGVVRSAFGLSGQKCSACSRVYVAREVYTDFLDRLAVRTAAVRIGDPTHRDTFLGPVVDAAAVSRFRGAVARASARGRVVAGGTVLQGEPGLPGYYVQPTVVADVPVDDELFVDELFVPFVVVAPVDSLDEAFALANATQYGLTAGFFSSDDSEVAMFLDRIEAGVVYVNRRAGATTGAWPGVQPFGGWKGSGTSGKAGGGLYYLTQFMREQSRTVVTP